MRVTTTFICLLISLFSFSQDKNVQRPRLKFGDIKEADFEPKAYSVDSNAAAVILADIGESRFEGNSKGDFSIEFKKHQRIRILNKNGFDAASVQIPIYFSGNDEEKVEDIEAVTYNLENGKVTATKLEKSSIFKDKINKNVMVKKFTFPNLKEGSIIEFRYKLISPFYFNLQPWEFQGSLPRLWTEYTVTIPSIFDFVFLRQGYLEYDFTDSKTSDERYYVMIPAQSATERNETITVTSPTITQAWGLKDVPALKQESFSTSLSNYVQKIEFQLREIRYPNQNPVDVMGSWEKLADRLMKSEDFGAALVSSNGFLADEMKKITAGSADNYEKAIRIYRYVRDNFTCTDHTSRYLSNPLKKTFQTKTGNVADINLLLTAMFRSQGFEAFPVLLSTRDNGRAYELYPLISRFNYVISRVKVGDEYFLLDASHNKLGFTKLPEEAYNGYARLIDKTPILLDLSADTLKESKLTSVFIINDENGKLTGSFTSTLGNFESYDLRNTLSKASKDDHFKEIKKSYSFDIKLDNTQVDSLQQYECPVAVKYDFSFKPEEDIIYLNPMFTEAQKDNPFKSADRRYPVEMPYTINETYILNMEIPSGYKVEEVPKSTRLKLNEDEGMFEYLISVSGNKIQLRSKLVLAKATFTNEDYQTLRDFFAYVVKKHSEQVVLKKTN